MVSPLWFPYLSSFPAPPPAPVISQKYPKKHTGWYANARVIHQIVKVQFGEFRSNPSLDVFVL